MSLQQLGLQNHHHHWEKPESSDCQVVLGILFKIIAKLCLAFKEFYKAHVEIKRPKDFNGADRGLDVEEILTCVGIKMVVPGDWCQKSTKMGERRGRRWRGPDTVGQRYLWINVRSAEDLKTPLCTCLMWAWAI